jgi:hypothetical protein
MKNHIRQHSMVCIQCNPNQSSVQVHLGKKGDRPRSYLKKSGEVKTTGSIHRTDTIKKILSNNPLRY